MGRTLMATAIKGGCCLTAVNGYTSKVFTEVVEVAEGVGPSPVCVFLREIGERSSFLLGTKSYFNVLDAKIKSYWCLLDKPLPPGSYS